MIIVYHIRIKFTLPGSLTISTWFHQSFDVLLDMWLLILCTPEFDSSTPYLICIESNLEHNHIPWQRSQKTNSQKQARKSKESQENIGYLDMSTLNILETTSAPQRRVKNPFIRFSALERERERRTQWRTSRRSGIAETRPKRVTSTVNWYQALRLSHFQWSGSVKPL